MNTAEYLVKKLESLGINDFFGLPGDYNFNIVYAIQDNPNTNWRGCTNELNAGYVADGYARQRGFGAIVTTYGVGELSAMNAIAGSYAENVPVINIVGVPNTKILEDKTLVHHNFSEPNTEAFQNAFSNVTATTAFLNFNNAQEEIDRILSVFVRERKPVYIAIPEDVATSEIQDNDTTYDWESDSDTLEKVLEKISLKVKEAKNPVILADVLIKRFDAKDEFNALVDKAGIPVTNFVMGTNIVPFDHPQYIGAYMSDFVNPLAKELLETTDCLIAVGTIYSDVNSFGFKLPYKINSQVAIYGTYTYIDGEKHENVKMKNVLEGLTRVLEVKTTEISKPELGYGNSSISAEKISSQYIYPRLQEFIKENDIIIAETGIIPHGVFRMKFPANAELHTQSLWCSIGWATPAAMGAAIATPDSRVILITGDGSHQISAMEIGSMLRNGLKPVILVVNNEGYTIERLLSNRPQNAMNDIVKMNYAKFARVFDGDIWATKVETPEDFDKALRVTQIMNKLCYIEICTDKNDIPSLAKEVFNPDINWEKKEDIVKQEPIAPVAETKINEPVAEIKSEEPAAEIKEEPVAAEQQQSAELPQFLKLSNDMVFETMVHESLRFDEQEDEK